MCPQSSVLHLESYLLFKQVKYPRFFNQKRGYPRAKIRIFEIFLTTLLTLSYENLESPIEDFFRIKSAGTSNYRGATFFASGNKKTISKLVFSEACPEHGRMDRMDLKQIQKIVNNQSERGIPNGHHFTKRHQSRLFCHIRPKQRPNRE